MSISPTSWRQSRVLQLCRQHVNANCSNCRADEARKIEWTKFEWRTAKGARIGNQRDRRSCVRSEVPKRKSRRDQTLMVNKYENFIDLRNTIQAHESQQYFMRWVWNLKCTHTSCSLIIIIIIISIIILESGEEVGYRARSPRHVHISRLLNKLPGVK